MNGRLSEYGLFLTGDSDTDILLLSEAAKENVLNTDLVEVIREALYDLIGKDASDTFIDTILETTAEYQQVMAESSDLMAAGKTDEAVLVLGNFIHKIEDLGLYQENETTQYFFFFSDFEKLLYLSHCTPEKAIRSVHFPISQLYLTYGLFLRQLDRREEAFEAIRKAYAFNPADPLVITNLAISYLGAGDQEVFLSVMNSAFKYTWDTENLTNIYNMLGSFYAAKDKPEPAIVCYTLAGKYGDSRDDIIKEIAAKYEIELKPLTREEIDACGKQYGFQTVPDETVIDLIRKAILEAKMFQDNDMLEAYQATLNSLISPLAD